LASPPGDPGVNNIRIYAHCVDEEPRETTPVVITHARREKGALRTKSVTLTKPESYGITTQDEPTNESVEFSALSRSRE
jgi:hypothetical protein